LTLLVYLLATLLRPLIHYGTLVLVLLLPAVTCRSLDATMHTPRYPQLLAARASWLSVVGIGALLPRFRHKRHLPRSQLHSLADSGQTAAAFLPLALGPELTSFMGIGRGINAAKLLVHRRSLCVRVVAVLAARSCLFAPHAVRSCP
jgi:hypothetical protein